MKPGLTAVGVFTSSVLFVAVSSLLYPVHTTTDVDPLRNVEVSPRAQGSVQSTTADLQALWCSATHDPYDERQGIGAVSRRGGGFAIRALLEFASPLRYQDYGVRGHLDVDYFRNPPGLDALVILRVVLPDAPISLDGLDTLEGRARQYERLKVWLAERETDWGRREPTGLGVNFSPAACKAGKPAV